MHPTLRTRRAVARALPMLCVLVGEPATAQELPPEVRMDRYMVQVDRQVGNHQYAAALRTLDLVLELQETSGLELPESFWMKRAEVAMGAGDPAEAITSVSRHLETAGRDADHYVEALELLDQAVEQACSPERMTESLGSVQTCLALGADPNGADEDGRTTLDWAGERGDPAIRTALVEAGADSAVAQSRPGRVFRDCSACPAMVVVPAGSFMMGASAEEGYENARPRHRVTIDYAFAVGLYEVTFAEWDACLQAGACGRYRPDDEGWGRRRRPVIHVSWEDAQEYVRWLSRETEADYRLLSEAEWEYTARAGTEPTGHWGESEWEPCRFVNGYDQTAHAKHGDRDWPALECSDGYADTAPVGSYQPNAFGLYDVLGNVWELTEDCYSADYSGAPADGSAWRAGDCSRRVIRGGAWYNDSRSLSVLLSARGSNPAGSGSRNRYGTGFRVGRTMN